MTRRAAVPIPAALVYDHPRSFELIVYTAMAAQADDFGRLLLDRPALASELQCSVETVTNAISRLKGWGCLARQQKTPEGIIYRLSWPKATNG
jgi:hypothetical protein